MRISDAKESVHKLPQPPQVVTRRESCLGIVLAVSCIFAIIFMCTGIGFIVYQLQVSASARELNRSKEVDMMEELESALQNNRLEIEDMIKKMQDNLQTQIEEKLYGGPNRKEWKFDDSSDGR